MALLFICYRWNHAGRPNPGDRTFLNGVCARDIDPPAVESYDVDPMQEDSATTYTLMPSVWSICINIRLLSAQCPLFALLFYCVIMTSEISETVVMHVITSTSIFFANRLVLSFELLGVWITVKPVSSGKPRSPHIVAPHATVNLHKGEHMYSVVVCPPSN